MILHTSLALSARMEALLLAQDKEGEKNRRYQKPSLRRSKFLPPSNGWLPPAVLSPATSPMSPQTFRTCHFPIPSKDGKQAGELGKLKEAVCPAPRPSPPHPPPPPCYLLGSGVGNPHQGFWPIPGDTALGRGSSMDIWNLKHLTTCLCSPETGAQEIG